MKRVRRLILVETAASIAWFAMDASWMLNARGWAVGLSAPTLALNLLAFAFLPKRWAPRLVAAAMVAWSAMNVLWMLHDLKLSASGLAYGKAFLVAGFVLLSAAIVVNHRDALRTIAARFRRLRISAASV
jgi:hypothetical protein